MFCVECGTETPELTESGLCRECFLRNLVLVRLPEKVDVEICVHCGSRKRGEVWRAPARASLRRRPEEDVGAEIAETAGLVKETVLDFIIVDKRLRNPAFHVTTSPTDNHQKHWATTVTGTGEVEGFRASGEAVTVVRVKGATCLRCSRMQGGYYEAIVQVRAKNRELTPDEFTAVRQLASRLIERIVADGDANAFVLRDLREEGGLDIYFGTTNAGRMIGKAIAQEMGGKATEHAKLVGQKDGLDLYRMTFAIRIPEYKRGDLVVVDDAPWLVQSIGSKLVVLRHPLTGATQSAQRDALDRAPVLDRAGAKDAVVVSRTEKEMQLLDPVTYATVTVTRPQGVPDEGPTVATVKWEDELIVLPPLRRDESASKG